MSKNPTTTQPIRDPLQVRSLIDYYLHRGQIRNHTLIVMGVYTALRISDLLNLKWGTVCNLKTKRIRKSITLYEKKTGKRKSLALNRDCIRALTHHLHTIIPTCENQALFENPQTCKPISRVQAYRIIRSASEDISLERHASCHSLRKTLGYHAWKTGASPAVIMEIYNHSSFATTRRYLGVAQDDENDVYLGLGF